MWEFIAGAAVAKFFFGGSSKKRRREVDDESDLDLATVEPGKHFDVRYGFERKASIRFVVRSSEGVRVYFVREAELEKFDKNEAFTTFSSSDGPIVSVTDRFAVHAGDYALVIHNTSKKTAAVSYGLWSSRR